jgi:hypothetical protein
MEFDPYKTASEWHGGQFTELYKLSSSGNIDSKSDLLSEIEKALSDVEKAPDKYADNEKDRLTDLMAWANEEFEDDKEEVESRLLLALAKAGIKVVNGNVRVSDIDRVLDVIVGSLFIMSENGNKVFDVSQFEIEELSDGSYAYVNHSEKMALTSFGGPEGVKRYPDGYLYNEGTLNKAKSRYEKLAKKT